MPASHTPPALLATLMCPLLLSSVLLATSPAAPQTRKAKAANTAPLPHAHIIRVTVELTRVSRKTGVVHWKITNHNDVPVFIYSTYLWGPIFPGTRKNEPGVIDTAPNEDTGEGCPSNLEPFLILRVAPNDFREGDFADPSLKTWTSDGISLRVAAGPEAERVTSDMYRAAKTCKPGPYDVLYDWSTILQTPTVAFPKDG